MGLFDAPSIAPSLGLSQLHLSASTLCKLEAPEPKGCSATRPKLWRNTELTYL